MEFSLAELSDTDGQSAASRAASSIRGERPAGGEGGPGGLPGTRAPRLPAPGRRSDKRPAVLSEPGSALSPRPSAPQGRLGDSGLLGSNLPRG